MKLVSSFINEFCFILFCGLSVGCASQVAKTTDDSTAAPSLLNQDLVRPGGVDTCDSTKAQMSDDNDLQWVDGRKLFVRSEGALVNLCDVLAKTGRDVVIFQFAGITCLSCQDEATYLEAQVSKGALGNRVAHVVVVTDFVEDFSEQEYREFFKLYAPNAVRVHDIKAQLWKGFSRDPSWPVRPTLVAMNSKMQAYVLNKENADFRKIVDYATSLAPLDSEGVK